MSQPKPGLNYNAIQNAPTMFRTGFKQQFRTISGKGQEQTNISPEQLPDFASEQLQDWQKQQPVVKPPTLSPPTEVPIVPMQSNGMPPVITNGMPPVIKPVDIRKNIKYQPTGPPLVGLKPKIPTRPIPLNPFSPLGPIPVNPIAQLDPPEYGDLVRRTNYWNGAPVIPGKQELPSRGDVPMTQLEADTQWAMRPSLPPSISTAATEPRPMIPGVFRPSESGWSSPTSTVPTFGTPAPSAPPSPRGAPLDFNPESRWATIVDLAPRDLVLAPVNNLVTVGNLSVQ